jgi:hypothetical protein
LTKLIKYQIDNYALQYFFLAYFSDFSKNSTGGRLSAEQAGDLLDVALVE